MLTLHFDYTSPAAAVALVRFQRLVDAGHRVTFLGLDTLGLNVAVPPTLTQLDELSRYRDRALALGLSMGRPTRCPPTLAAHLVGRYADEQGLGASWRSVCLQAYWADDVDLSDEWELHRIAVEAGLAGDAVRDLLDDGAARQALRGQMTARRRAGIGGVPVAEASGGVFVSADLPDPDLELLAAL